MLPSATLNLVAVLFSVPAAGLATKKDSLGNIVATSSTRLRHTAPAGNASAVLTHVTSEVKTPAHDFGGTYTLWEPTGGAEASLIILGPWNSTPGFFKPWIIEQFEKSEPKSFSRYRILDVVGKQGPKDETNPYGYSTWYEYHDWHKEIPVASDVDQAVSFVHSLLDQEAAKVESGNIVLAGFSQGANIAIESAVRYRSALALVFSERGVLLGTRTQDPPALAATPYVLTGGGDDHVYHEDLVKGSCKWLDERHVPAYLKVIPGLGHYRYSTKENELANKAFAAVVSKAPLAGLAEWTNCRK